jgi:predicted HTH domain antitoxin
MTMKTISLRLPREIIESLEIIAKSQHLKKTELARKLIIEKTQKERIELAKSLYTKGKVTFLRACKIAGLHPLEFISEIPQTEIEEEDLELIKEHLK